MVFPSFYLTIRPIALNTVELMRVASSGLGMSPQHAMMIAEKLYTQGYISYPRTESTQYAENFDLKDVLRQQQNNNEWGSYVKDLMSKGINKPRKGHDAGTHSILSGDVGTWAALRGKDTPPLQVTLIA